MALYDEDVLLLRPMFALDAGRIETAIASVPGAFQHPLQSERWVLPGSAALADRTRERMERGEPIFTTQVRRGERIEVIPDGRRWTRAARAGSWRRLLAMGPFELEVGGRVLGVVRSVADIYGDSPWVDPDLTTDPTESPPRTGTLVTFYRIEGRCEALSIHDSGVVSYEVDSGEKTYRRVASEYEARLRELIARLPFLEEDGSGMDGAYVDPAYVRYETPTGDGRDAKLDVARPSADVAAFVKLVDGWARALRQERDGMPEGLVALE